jgi:hypothetical protein
MKSEKSKEKGKSDLENKKRNEHECSALFPVFFNIFGSRLSKSMLIKQGFDSKYRRLIDNIRG